ncbi:MAG TPA: hypothetical protein VJ946_11375, partial [Bacteroidales bacterium]|nr:hypothetical protein [Bacteroidales bacterium]
KNTASYSGGGIEGTVYTVVANTILWGNSLDQTGGDVNISFSNIENGYEGPGNISISPGFIDPDGKDNKSGTPDDNFHLSLGSPCIDSGSNGAAALPLTDAMHNTRIMDGKNDNFCIVDMGIYESPGPAGCPKPSEVWVDDDWKESTAGMAMDGYLFGATAFSQIQHAINAVKPPGTVNVAPGTYYETLVMKSGVEILGSGIDSTIIDGNAEGTTITATNVDSTSKIQAATIQNGKSSTGGGLHIKNSEIKLIGLKIFGNTAYYRYNSDDKWYPERQLARGGGAYILGGAPTIESCIFYGNTAASANGQDTLGGGIYCESSSPSIDNCTFAFNYTVDH